MSHDITLTDAVTMTTAFRADKETILASNFKNQNILPICETFDKAEVLTLMAQEGCTQLRIYYSMDTDYTVHAVLVAANASDQDIISLSSDASILLEKGKRCPIYCPPASVLNS